MSSEEISAWAAVGTLVVIGTSALAALVQLHHLRASNQLQALLTLERDFRAPELQHALRYAQETLPQALEDPHYRFELERRGFVDVAAHPELLLCNWFNEIGALLKHRVVTEDTFMDMFARLITYYWKALSPAIAVMRRSRGDYQYHDFEYLAARAQLWLKRNPAGLFPRGITREKLADPWRESDAHSVSLER